MEQRCGFNVSQGSAAQLSRYLIETIKEETLQMFNRVDSRIAASVVKHLIQMLRSTVIARMLWVPKAIGVSELKSNDAHPIL